MDNIKNAIFAKMKAAGRSNEMTVKFKVMDTDESRVVMVLNIMETFEIAPQAKHKTKNKNTSIDFRNEANRMYVLSKNNIDDLIKAWELYSKSIATAPNSSQELSLAYANRSALLMTLNKYTDCINDINKALELNYPNHLRGKLLFRKIDCLIALHEIDDIKSIIEEAKNWLQNINLNNEKREEFEEKLKKIESVINLNSISKTEKIKISSPNVISNEETLSALDAITVKYNEKFGRHVVTTRKVEPGEILVSEKPYAIFLDPEKAYTHCSYCLQVYWSLIPCEFCVHAMYCSFQCKDKAWKQYHDIECVITGYLLDLNYNKCSLFSMRLAILAIREVGSIKKLKSYLQKVDSYCNDPDKQSFGKDGIYQSDKYEGIYTLVTNTQKRSIGDLFEKSLNAAFILYYLCTLSNLLGKKFDTDIHEISTNEDVTYIGGLILRHMQIIPCNIHSYEEEYKIDIIDIGASALPICSLINHSCDPNVSRCSTKDYMIIFALTPIEKGSQIFDNYGCHYAVMNRFEREQKLKQYYFTCECIPCTQNWPTYQNLLSFQKLLTDKEIEKKVEKVLDKFNMYVDYATKDQIEDKPYLLPNLTRIIISLLEYVPLPCREINNAVETLKRVMFLTHGNKFKIPKLNL